MSKDDFSTIGWAIQNNGSSSGSMNLRIDTSAAVNQIKSWNGSDNFYDGNWHFVAFTTTAASQLSLHKDGALDTSGTYSVGSGFCSTALPIYIGNNALASFDELAIWTKALTASEIQTVYARQSP